MEKLTTNNEGVYTSPEKKEIRSTIAVFVNLFIILALYLVSFVVIDTSANIDWGKRGYEMVLIYFAGYTIFSNSYNIGKISGSKKSTYIESEKTCREALDKLQENPCFENLEQFCEYVKTQDLNARRKTTLGAVCIKWEKWLEEYSAKSLKELFAMKKRVKIDGKEKVVSFFDVQQKIALIKAKRMRYHKFTVAMLTSPVSVKSDEFINNPVKCERSKKMRRLIISALFALISVNFSANLVKDFSFQTVVESVIKSLSLLWAWVSGQFSGYSNAVNDKVDYFTNKAKWCNRADKWLKDHSTVAITPIEPKEKEGEEIPLEQAELTE